MNQTKTKKTTRLKSNSKNENKFKPLQMIIVVVPKGKKPIFIDLLEKHQVNFEMSFYGKGTATNDILELMGIENKEKDVIIGVLREDLVKDCILELDDKLKTLKKLDGIAFSLPFESIIGNMNYLFLGNLRSDGIGK